MDKRFNEFTVVGRIVKGQFKIDKKEPTARGHVMISDRDADTNNRQTRFNFLHYELAEEVKSPERIALEEEAIELGVSFRANIGDAKLQEKINEAK
ncbi:unnamed protein product [marine sediment metagenome]|uniref:Uncharacterized protein n=1 Tax=marine sediment metagenome TaxID=412755 RepID=X0SPG1_9ZZZZ